MSRRIPPAEGTEAPWWVIIDPRQMMRADADKVADMVTGPFLSPAEAQEDVERHVGEVGHTVAMTMGRVRPAACRSARPPT